MRGGAAMSYGAAPVFQIGSMSKEGNTMVSFLLWCILLVFCWPLALIIAVLIPLVWLIVLPFRIAAAVIGGMLSLVFGILTLPFRLIAKC